MRALLQRVLSAAVEANGERAGSIGPGLLVFLGVGRNDERKDADYLAAKVLQLRIFEDAAGKMNRSVLETGGSILVVSQFTLYADCRKGRRPGFDMAAPPDIARELYDYFSGLLRDSGLRVETGVFRAHMLVSLVNDGPITLMVDSWDAKG